MRTAGGTRAFGKQYMSKDDATGTEEGTAAPQRDASLRVDTKSLSSEEQDFARMMGFAGDENPPAAESSPGKPSPERKPSATSTPPARPAALLGPSTAPIAPSLAAPATPAEAASPPSKDWEEIHPRAAALGRQTALVERADRVMKLEPDVIADPAPSSPANDATADERTVDDADWRERLQIREARIAELERSERALRDALATRPPESALRAELPGATRLANPESEKETEALRSELEIVLQERDRFGDDLAIANAARAQAEARAERFETALRAARGADGPLPDGERDLRAEVIGLRRRLEDAGAETRRLREVLDTGATDLAIAHAHRDDRQQEIEQHKDRITALEQDRAAQVERLDEALVRQRELLALLTRVRAENVELRSTQAALEETLEARDLEINAREEHLQVTRRGLAARDQQLLDVEERLEQERHRHEALEAELERARNAASDLEAKLARRDARVASLSTTLTRIEQAIGRPAPSPTIGASERAGSPEPLRRRDRENVPRGPVKAETPRASQASPSAAPDASIMPNRGLAPALAPPAAQPPILASWRDAQLRSICGEAAASSLHAYLAKRLFDHFAGSPPEALRITSLGGARADAEVALVRALEARGSGPASIRVLECSEESAATRRDVIEAAGLSALIRVETWEGAQAPAGEPAHVLFLSDALWGQPHPERLLERLSNGLVEKGVLLFVDRIAGGAVTLSPETADKLAELWQVLPESWTDRAAFASPPAMGDDGGTAVPASDLGAALCRRFDPIVTVGFGHIADLFVGPARGFEISQAGSAADPLLTSIDAIDESRSILESLPARHGVAVWLHRGDAEAIGSSASGSRESLGLVWAGLDC